MNGYAPPAISRPNAGAMVSPFDAPRDWTADECDALDALKRASAALKTVRAELAKASHLSFDAERLLQDADMQAEAISDAIISAARTIEDGE